MTLLRSTIAIAFAAILVGPAAGQAPTAPRVLGSLLMLLVIVDVCEPAITPDQRAEITAAGERLQARAGISDAEIEALGAEIMGEVRRESCGEARAAFNDVYRQIMADAAAIP